MISSEKLRGIEVLTFDCYGTLIDWETGILGALKPVLAAHGKVCEDREILEQYAELEAEIEAGPYRRYREVLGMVVEGFGRKHGFSPTPAQKESLAESVPRWKPFPDTVDALRALSRRFKLGIISNVDADLFDSSAEQLSTAFDWIVLADSVGAYKPSAQNFVAAIQATGRPANRMMHAAQSLYHDVIPARVLGLTAVLVERRGFGAAKRAEADPDLTVPDLKTLADTLMKASLNC